MCRPQAVVGAAVDTLAPRDVSSSDDEEEAAASSTEEEDFEEDCETSRDLDASFARYGGSQGHAPPAYASSPGRMI
eukprot:COSAG01_NODE_10097_length_2251_cov_4.927974_5_plen_76_part_00